LISDQQIFSREMW